MTIPNQIIETKCPHAIWVLFSNLTGLLNWDCLSVWQRFNKFPTWNRWPRWSFTRYTTWDINLLECMYYYRLHFKDCVLALVSSSPVCLKDDTKITFVNTFTGRSLHRFWIYWRCLHSGASIIIHTKQIAKMLHVQIYFKIRFLASIFNLISYVECEEVVPRSA